MASSLYVRALEEMGIKKATTSDLMVNIIENKNPLYHLLRPLASDKEQHGHILKTPFYWRCNSDF